MGNLLLRGGAVGGLMLVVACASGTPTTLPAIDLSETRQASALLVEGESPRGFEGPDGVVKGRVAGAGLGAGAVMGALFLSGPNPANYLLAPVALPAAVLVGAVKAHSVADVEAAMAAFQAVGQDEALLKSLDRRLVDALGSHATRQWPCVAAISVSADSPCAGQGSAARIRLQPVFTIRSDGNFNPDIYFEGRVTAIVTMEGAVPGAPPVRLLEAQWAHRRELGSFFDLAADDGAPLRRQLELILDRFAVAIAYDLYLAPRPQQVRKVQSIRYDPENPWGQQTTVTRIEPPHWTFVRMGQVPLETGPGGGGTPDRNGSLPVTPADVSPMIARVQVEAYLEDNGSRFNADLVRYLQRAFCRQPCRWNGVYIRSHEILQADGATVTLRLDYSYRGRVQRSASRVFLLEWRDGKLVFTSHRKV